jgi:hypothetical protein
MGFEQRVNVERIKKCLGSPRPYVRLDDRERAQLWNGILQVVEQRSVSIVCVDKEFE